MSSNKGTYTPKVRESILRTKKRNVIKKIFNRIRMRYDDAPQKPSYDEFINLFKSLPVSKGRTPKITEQDYVDYQYYVSLKEYRKYKKQVQQNIESVKRDILGE